PPGQVEHNGKKFGHVLYAVAVLGTEMPAVSDLAGLAAALYSQQFSTTALTPITFTQGNQSAMFTQEQVDALIDAAVKKAVDATKGEFTAKVGSLEAQV